MTIKQIEQQLAIPRATIRFYEKENLISPKRNDNSYREYSDEDVAILKKVIILRKIGLSVSDIKKVLDGDCSLQALLENNISELQRQIEELEGAIRVSRIMQERKEDIFALDENLYWNELDRLEKSGFRFKEIINDVIEFEKGIVLKTFDIASHDGKPLYGLKESIIRAIGLCILFGLMWYFLEGPERSLNIFWEGFFWPFTAILIYSVLGLPVYFIGKKNPRLAEIIKKVGMAAAVVITLLFVALVIFVICKK